jgi:hypothetical protein
MKTAVEWLEEKIKANPFRIENDRLWNESKEMEKDQIRIAYMEGAFEKMRHLEGKEFMMPTEYYYETFKSE